MYQKGILKTSYFHFICGVSRAAGKGNRIELLLLFFSFSSFANKPTTHTHKNDKPTHSKICTRGKFDEGGRAGRRRGLTDGSPKMPSGGRTKTIIKTKILKNQKHGTGFLLSFLVVLQVATFKIDCLYIIYPIFASRGAGLFNFVSYFIIIVGEKCLFQDCFASREKGIITIRR